MFANFGGLAVAEVHMLFANCGGLANLMFSVVRDRRPGVDHSSTSSPIARSRCRRRSSSLGFVYLATDDSPT